MAEFDYTGWVDRAQAFMSDLGSLSYTEVRSAHVTAPATEADMQALEAELGRTIPFSLRTFFTRGASGLDCRYTVQPEGQVLDKLRGVLPDVSSIYGGARLGPVSELANFSRAVREWADETWVAEYPEDRLVWDSALPFIWLANGDYLALDLRAIETDPPVIYLSHDDESFLLSPDFVAFLSAWERLCYIGPEDWLLREFTGPNGYLDAESDRASQLRGLFVG
jgi:hypothetical protein